MQFAKPSELAHSLVHKDRAAVHRGKNRIRGNKENSQRSRLRGKRAERIAEVTAERPAERFAVGDSSQGLGTRAGSQRSRKLKRRPCDSRKTGALRRIAEEPAQHR